MCIRDRSPSGDYIAFVEQDNNVNMWSRSNGMTGFTNSSALLEYPDFVDDGPLPSNNHIDDFNYSLSSVGSVSYTHLDVYKRQATSCVTYGHGSRFCVWFLRFC